MKARINYKIFFTFICLCVFASAAVAQKEPEAILIGEYQFGEGADDELSAFERLTEQLIFRLTQEPETTIGLINVIERDVRGERVKEILAKHPGLKNKIRYGSPNYNSYKPKYKAGFWIVPSGAKLPDVGSDEPLCVCPVYDVTGAEFADIAAGNLTFTASVEGKNQKVITYKWDVSAGKIVKGQGTNIIKVDPQGAKQVTAHVRIGGTCDDSLCPLSGWATTDIQQ